MTAPTLPAFIPSARQRNRQRLTQLQRLRRHARRKELIEYCILFAFFTFFFAIATIAAFS